MSARAIERDAAFPDPPADAARPTELPPRPGTTLRLRDFGVTPVFWISMISLSFAAQIGFIGFILFLKHVSDAVSESKNQDSIIGFAMLFLFVTIAAGLYLHLRNKMMMAVAERLGMRLQALAVQAAVRSAVRTETSKGMAVLSDINQVRKFFTGGAPLQTFDLVGSVVATGLLFYLDAVLGWIAVGGIVAVVIIGTVMHYATRTMVQRARAEMSETAAELAGPMVHPDLVRGIGLLGPTMFRWQARYDTALDTASETRARIDSLIGIQDVVAEGFHMAIKAFACYLVFIHVGTVGMLIACAFFSSQAIEPFAGIVRNWERWTFTHAAWKRVQTALRDDGEVASKPPETDTPAGLVLENVGFWPEGRPKPIVSGISLRLPPGTAISVEGPNGVGKSTLLRLTLGLLQPTSGRVLLDGQDTHFCERGMMGDRIGYLPQDVQLLEGSVFQNIGRGPDAPPAAVTAAARIAGAHDMIGRLPQGYLTAAGNLSGLSAGQRRLVGLARAVYGDPRLLVMDEPEVGLDGQARTALRNAVSATRARGGIVLVVTHEPENWVSAVDLRLILGPRGTWQVQPAQPQSESMEGLTDAAA